MLLRFCFLIICLVLSACTYVTESIEPVEFLPVSEKRLDTVVAVISEETRNKTVTADWGSISDKYIMPFGQLLEGSMDSFLDTVSESHSLVVSENDIQAENTKILFIEIAETSRLKYGVTIFNKQRAYFDVEYRLVDESGVELASGVVKGEGGSAKSSQSFVIGPALLPVYNPFEAAFITATQNALGLALIDLQHVVLGFAEVASE